MRILPVVLLATMAAAGLGYFAWQKGESVGQAPNADSASIPPPATTDRINRPNAAESYADASTDCTIVRHYLPRADGTTIEALSCERDAAEAKHPYESYPSAALRSLAYSDAKAAEILGMRLIESDAAESLSLIVRAAALSGGNAAPLRAYSNAWPHPVRVDGVPQPKTVRVKYVLDAVADLLRDGPAAPNHWETLVREHSADPDQEIALLEARARAIVDEMRRIQLDVSGTSTIGGPGDA